MYVVIDVIYGVLVEGDIGWYFFLSEMEWKDVDSVIFLKYVVDLVVFKGFMISNIDCILICECFKIGLNVSKMILCMVELMGMEEDCVSIKVIISECFGFIGCEEGIVVFVIVILLKL